LQRTCSGLAADLQRTCSSGHESLVKPAGYLL
jgi:hypothetical protein